MSIAAINPIATTPTAATPAPARTPVAPAPTVAAPADSLQRAVPTGSAPAVMALPQDAAGDGVDFTKLFDGFAVGGKVKIGCSIPLAGGKATIEALDAQHLKLSGHVSIVGIINQDLTVDLHPDTDGTYRMTGNFDLHVSVKQEGNKVTVTDLDSPTHHVYFTANGRGTVDVKTVGMGFDKIKGSLKAK